MSVVVGGAGSALLGCDLPPERAPGGPRVLGSDPEDGDEGVDPYVAPRVYFDRPVFFGDIHRGRMSLRSGARAAFLSGWFDPVDRVLTIENLTPPIAPDVVHRLTVTGIRDLDLDEMPDDYVVAFTTGEDGGPPRPADAVGWSSVAPIFERCAVDGCHGGSTPMLGLDLSSPDAIERTAVGVGAIETRVGTQGDTVWRGSPTLGGMARIEARAGLGDPARSYLLYKVIGDPHAVGARMPPPPDAPLDPSELRALSRWIRAGAPTL
ncbi:MAG: Ig-like domain-containing protein [Sandaracinaceae bacterium]